MAINATTLSSAVALTDLTVTVASATGITAPNFQTGSGITYLLVEQELMQVTSVTGTVIGVIRGINGTCSGAHATGVYVIAGLPTDFTQFSPAIKAQQDFLPNTNTGFSGSIVGTATELPPGAYYHRSGTVALVTLTLPAGVVSGAEINIVFDGSAAGLTWTAAGNISVAGTATTAQSLVTFVYDAGITKWIPSRLA